MRCPSPARLARLALPLVFFATISSAAAATLDDPAAGLHLTLDTPGAQVCVVLPVASRSAAGCEGIDVEKAVTQLQQSKADKISGFAMIMFPDWSLIVTLKSDMNVAVRTAEDIKSLLDGLKVGAVSMGVSPDKVSFHGEAPGASHDIGKVNEVNYLRTRVEYDVPADSALYDGSRTFLYLLDGKEATHLLLFTTDPEHAAAARPVAEAIVRTLVLPPSRFESYGKPRAFAMAETLGKLTLPVVATLVSIFLVMRSRLKKKKDTPRG